MLWYVDCTRDGADLTAFQTHDGDVSHFKIFPKNATFDVMSQVLLLNIFKNKPEQIIFDKNGLGLGFYDAFIKDIKGIDSVKMSASGKLTYN